MSIKLIAFDMDGTTLNSKHIVPKENINAFEYALSKGIILVPASGRMVSLIPEDIFSIDGIRYIISSNGACVYDIKDNQEIYSNHISIDFVEEIFTELAPLNLYFEIYSSGKVIMDSECMKRFKSNGYLDIYPNEFSGCIYTVDNIIEYVKQNKMNVEKINIPFIGGCDKLEPLCNILRKYSCISVTTSGFDNLELNAKNTSKADALKHLCKYLNISSEHIMAIGDNYNDIEMISFAGTGIAMGNAPKALKNISDYITSDNDHFGVAKAIERFIK